MIFTTVAAILSSVSWYMTSVRFFVLLYLATIKHFPNAPLQPESFLFRCRWTLRIPRRTIAALPVDEERIVNATGAKSGGTAPEAHNLSKTWPLPKFSRKPTPTGSQKDFGSPPNIN
jgi:hypothetical protein